MYSMTKVHLYLCKIQHTMDKERTVSTRCATSTNTMQQKGIKCHTI